MKSFFSKMIFLLVTVTFLVPCVPSCKKESKSQAQQNTFVTDNEELRERRDSVQKSGDYRMVEYDTPPQPTSNPYPPYPKKFRPTGIQGVVVLDVEVLEDGKVGEVLVNKSLLSSEGGLDETAVMAVKKWMFEPAMYEKKPVKARVTVTVPFFLKPNKD